MKFNSKVLDMRGIAHVAILAAVVVGVGVLGAYYVVSSHADTVVSYVGFYNYTSTANGAQTSQGYNGVSAVTDAVNGIGAQTVSSVNPGSKLIYSGFGPGKVTTSSTCYMVRVTPATNATTTETSAPIQFVGEGNALNARIPADNVYHKYCVNTSTGAQLAYSLYNKSAVSNVLVYQAFVNYN